MDTMDRTTVAGVTGTEPALAGRVLFATGLLVAAWFVLVDPEPSTAVTVVVFAAGAATVLDALLTAYQLRSEAGEHLVGRALAAAGVGAAALVALSEGGLGAFASTTEVLSTFIGAALGLVAYGLLFFFVHGVHRALRPASSPVSLWVALVSAGVGAIVALAPVSDLIEGLLTVSAPLALMAVTVLRPSGE